MSQKINPKWLTPLTQGYFGQEEGTVDGRKIQITLLTRRMYNKAGTRNTSRGIDDLGFVAN